MKLLIFFCLFGNVASYIAPIVFANECNHLKTQIAEASHGDKFLLMTNLATDTHTRKEPTEIRDNLRFILQLSLLFRFSTGIPIIQLDTTYTQYLSDENKLRYSSHNDVVQALNLVRGFIQGGIGDIVHYEDWVVSENKQYKQVLSRIDECIRFINTFHIRRQLSIDNYYVGHAASIISYEKEMTRNDSVSKKMYDCSSHFLWIENLPDPLMIEHLSCVENPVGIVVKDTTPHNLVLEAIEKLNPQNEPGRITIIVRMRSLRSNLSLLIDKIQTKKYNILWCCDPSCLVNMHRFLRIHHKKQTIPGGIFINSRDLDPIQYLSYYLKTTSTPIKKDSKWNRFSL
jgi:3-deoxy-7-phosphoheptulonate synthase